jgi:hypothetical protein
MNLNAMGPWLDATAPSMFIKEHTLIWPVCQTLHFFGLILLFGNVGLLDLRMLGVMKELPAKPLNRFIRWGVLGFTTNLVTGIIFFVGQPNQYIGNKTFYAKLLFIALAGLNVGGFYASGIFRKVERLGPGDEAPMGAKCIAVTSLGLWVGVMYCGRMLTFLGNAF